MTTAIVERIRSHLITHQHEATPSRVADAVRAEGLLVGDDDMLTLVSQLQQEFTGAGPLESLMRMPTVTDVLVNGPNSVWIDRGQGPERTDVTFASEEDVRRLAQRLAASAGRRLDESMPYVDARMNDGSRLHAVVPPIATDGTVISLRIPRRAAFTLDEFTASGMCDATGAMWLSAIVTARLAFLISGGTGTGKTTVLSTLLGLVDPGERIVIVEDSAELRPEHQHLVRLQARPANVEGAGTITMRDLVRQALRMRPDRLVVGEVRGAEVIDLLSALNTGHEGGCGTLHANSATDVPARLEALGLVAGLDRTAIHALTAAGLDAVIHLDRERSGKRILSGVHVFVHSERGTSTQPALRRVDGVLVAEPGLGVLADRLARVGVRVP
jgi:pilus assembly protein CpaF